MPHAKLFHMGYGVIHFKNIKFWGSVRLIENNIVDNNLYPSNKETYS